MAGKKRTNTTGYVTVLFLMAKDERNDSILGHVLDAYRAHTKHITWQPNPHRAAVEKFKRGSAEQALLFAAGRLPSGILDAVLIDTQLGVVPVVGDEICLHE